ncbi:MAG: tetratricopeptide repeat protein [Myxococcota bacterium]
MPNWLPLQTCNVDLESGRLSGGRQGQLTERERTLLAYLVERPRQGVSRAELAKQAFGYSANSRTRAVDKTMFNLRKKVEAAGAPVHLLTRHGSGYMFVPLDASQTPSPPPRSPSVPTPRGRFVGRVGDLELLDAQMQTHRLVSVVGLGGFGKTRLAVEWAGRQRAAWPGGIWFCDLSEATSRDGVLFAIARALETRLGAKPTDQLANLFVHRGRCVLLLDNAEGAIEPLPGLLEVWTREAPEAHVLVTSRVPLGIRDECVLPLGPLDPRDALELYTQSAALARPARAQSDADAEALPELLRLLDHVPLAIELAAARVRVLPPSRLLPRLTDRFRVLVRRHQSEDRHRSLQEILDWSWELLTPAEQQGLAQLSVFEGGFTLDAAEAVLETEVWAIDVLQRLVDLSWVRDHGDDRYDLLVSVQAYAARHLTDPRPAALRHATFYANLTGDGNGLHPPPLPEALSWDVDNLVATCRRAADLGEANLGIHALSAFWWVVRSRGPYQAWLDLADEFETTTELSEAQTLQLDWRRLQLLMRSGRMEEAEARLEGLTETASRVCLGQLDEARVHLERCRFLIGKGRLDEARAAVLVALGIANTVGHARLEAAALAMLGDLQRQTGELDESLANHQAALDQYRAIGDALSEATVLTNYGNLLYRQRRLSESAAYYQAGLQLARSVGDHSIELSCLNGLGMVQLDQQQLGDARRTFIEVLHLVRATGILNVEAAVLNNLGSVTQEQGDFAEAQRHFDDALRSARKAGQRFRECAALVNLGTLAHERSNHEKAEEILEEALHVSREIGMTMAESLVLIRLSQIHIARGELDQALERLSEGEAAAVASGSPSRLVGVLVSQVDALWRRGDHDEAQRVLERAESLVPEEDLDSQRRVTEARTWVTPGLQRLPS